MKERIVFAVVVTSRHFLADIFQNFKNMIGMRLTSYEDMISEAIEKALYQLYKTYPDVYDVKIMSTQVAANAADIIAYGKVMVDE